MTGKISTGDAGYQLLEEAQASNLGDRVDQAEILPGVRGAVVFYMLTFAMSWAIWGTRIVFPETADWAPLIILAGAYGPLLAALLLNRAAGGRGAARRWFRAAAGVRGRGRWLLLGGLVLPLAIALAHLGLYHLLVAPFTLSTNPPWYWAASAAPLNVLLLFWMGSAVEEFGWQGFALPRLSQQLPLLPALIIHGLLWGSWHLPLYLTGSWRGDGQDVWLLYAITLTLTPTMVWLTRRAGGSALPAVLLHAATNHYSSLFTEELDYAVFTRPLEAHFIEIKVCLYLVMAVVVWLGGRLIQHRRSPAAPLSG